MELFFRTRTSGEFNQMLGPDYSNMDTVFGAPIHPKLSDLINPATGRVYDGSPLGQVTRQILSSSDASEYVLATDHLVVLEPSTPQQTHGGILGKLGNTLQTKLQAGDWELDQGNPSANYREVAGYFPIIFDVANTNREKLLLELIK